MSQEIILFVEWNLGLMPVFVCVHVCVRVHVCVHVCIVVGGCTLG